MTRLPKNVVVRRVLVTDLSQALKKQRDFLKWMARRYAGDNADQSAAFGTGAEILDELRNDLVAGLFDVAPAAGQKELFSRGALPAISPATELDLQDPDLMAVTSDD